MKIIRWSFVLTLMIVTSVGAYAADGELRGLQLGTVGAFGGGGGAYSSGSTGVHPSFGGGIDVGINRYVGIFGEGGYSRIMNETTTGCYGGYCVSASAKASLITFAAGFEFVGTNRSRIVPYGKLGMGYGRAQGSVMGFGASTGAPAVAFGGGLRTYFNRHVGAEVQVLALRFVGNNGGGTTAVGMFGIFVQSK